jgi:hypothetical protein
MTWISKRRLFCDPQSFLRFSLENVGMSHVIETDPNMKELNGRARAALLVTLVLLALMLVSGLIPGAIKAEPLEHDSFATLGCKPYYSWINGRMGFEQENGGIGTLNDFQADLGLPLENMTVEIDMAVRPLEHHVLRVYGRVPELYKGSNILSRELRTRLISLEPILPHVYPAGSLVQSQLRLGMFGFGYDLDFVVGPRWYGGLNGDLRYLYLQVRMTNATSGLEDTMTLSELTPCLGAHGQFRLPLPGGAWFNGPTLGGFSRLTYGITPNFFNYVDFSMGAAFTARPTYFWAFEAKVGYQHESFFSNQENVIGRSFELKRDGVFVSLDVLY